MRSIVCSILVALGLVASGTAYAGCLDEFPNVMSPQVGAARDGLKVAPAPNTVVDLRGATVRGMGRGSDAKSILTVRGFDGVCILGGRYLGDQDPQVVPWVDGHKEYGAGILFQGGHGRIVVEQAVIANSLQDGITLAGGLPGDVTFELRSSWIANTSDDGIQNDGGKRIDGIEDSLIEAKMGLSLRPGRDARGGGFGDGVVPIRNSLFNIICVADDRPDGSDSRNKAGAQKNNCGPSKSVSSAFKWSGDAGKTRVDVSDTVIRFGGRDRNGWRAMDWPNGTYRNVTVVWDPATPGMRYEGPELPDGVTMTTDASVWTKAKAAWLRAHGCDEAELSCSFDGTAPGPDPDPDPQTNLITRLQQSYPAANLSRQEWRAVIATVRKARP